MGKEHLKELGKQLLNIGVAVVVFAIIQPIVSENIRPIVSLVAFFIYLLLTIIGVLLIKKGEKNEL